MVHIRGAIEALLLQTKDFIWLLSLHPFALVFKDLFLSVEIGKYHWESLLCFPIMTLHHAFYKVILNWTFSARSELGCFKETLFKVLKIVVVLLNWLDSFKILLRIKLSCGTRGHWGSTIDCLSLYGPIIELGTHIDWIKRVELMKCWLSFIYRSASSEMNWLKRGASFATIIISCPIIRRFCGIELS